jgi:hypothetical protein
MDCDRLHVTKTRKGHPANWRSDFLSSPHTLNRYSCSSSVLAVRYLSSGISLHANVNFPVLLFCGYKVFHKLSTVNKTFGEYSVSVDTFQVQTQTLTQSIYLSLCATSSFRCSPIDAKPPSITVTACLDLFVFISSLSFVLICICFM